MPAIINHKICDQASACGGISVCPVGAFTYNEKTKRIEIDNTKCISCGACEKTCPIGAIGVARTQEEFEELKQAIEEDPRNPDDLFVDRYGGDIINEDVMIEFSQIDDIISKETAVVVMADDIISNYTIIRHMKKMALAPEKIVDKTLDKKMFNGEYDKSGLKVSEYSGLRNAFVAFLKEQDSRLA